VFILKFGDMALTASDKKEIEVIIRKEIKDFVGSTTMKQYEEKLLNLIASEINRGKIHGNIKDIIIRVFREFYYYMWSQKSTWEGKLKNA
jgi:hypothetical protein